MLGRFFTAAACAASVASGLVFAAACSGGGDGASGPAGIDGGSDARTGGDAVAPPPIDDASGGGIDWSKVTASTCWNYVFGDAYDSVSVQAIHPSGDVLVTGEFQGTIDLRGTVLTAGPPADSGVGSEIATFAARLRKSDGTAVWARIIGQPGDTRNWSSAAMDPNGSLVIGGELHDHIDSLDIDPITPGESSMFLARLDGDTGDTIATRVFEAWGLRRIRRASDGTYVIGGYGYVNLDGTPTSNVVWSSRLSLDDGKASWVDKIPYEASGTTYFDTLDLDDNGDVLVARHGEPYDWVALAKLSGTAGTHVWDHTYRSLKQATRISDIASAGSEVLATGGYATPPVGPRIDAGVKSGVWVAAWDGADGGELRTFLVDSNERGQLGVFGDGTTYLAAGRLYVFDPKTGISPAPKPLDVSGLRDPQSDRWYAGGQYGIGCTELHWNQ